MGADKYENEDLIRYGLPEDWWFHVDDMSSAHVYLRLRKNQRIEEVSPATIQECASLVKANSIEGCKLKQVKVVYTPWRNLNKTADMDIGAIGFHDNSQVRSLRVEKNNATVKQLEKTKKTEFPNLAELQEQRNVEIRSGLKADRREKLAAEKQHRKEQEEQAKLRSYSSIMVEDHMKSNADFEGTIDDSAAKDYEDDFM